MSSLQDEPTPRRRSTRQGTRLDENWRRSPADIEWQHGEGIPDEFARLHTANFKDYFLASTSPRAWKLDWSRAWKVWIRTEWMKLPLRKRDEYRALARQAVAAPAQRVPEALMR